MKINRILSVLVVFCLATVLITGCATNTPAGSSKSTSASASTAENLNNTGMLNLVLNTTDMCQSPWADLQSLYVYMVFDPLYSFNVKGEVVPKLASKVDISEDGKTYTFTIAKNVKWHDGQPFTADDVAFSLYGVIADPKSGMGASMMKIEGAQDVKDGKATSLSGVTVNGSTVTVKLIAADSSCYKSIPSIMILPKHIFGSMKPEEWQKNAAFWTAPIGTGMYKVEKFKASDYMKLVRNDEYFRAPAKIKNVLLKCFSSDAMDAAVASMIAGDLDYVYGNAFNDISTAKNITKQNTKTKMLMMTSNYVRYMISNLSGSTDKKQNPGMQDARVRHALNLLLDKEAIAAFYGEQAIPMTTFVNSADPMYNDDIAPFKRNVEKAKELLNAANFDYSKPIRITYYYADQTTKDVMELIKQNFTEAGVKCETTLATGDLGSVLYEVKNFDLMYAGGFKADPVLNMQANTVGGGEDILLVNDAYRKEKFNKILDAYKATLDPVEAKKLADELQVVSAQECFTFPVYGLNKIILYNTAKLKLPEELFTIDNEQTRDYRFEDWSLVG